MGVTSYEEQYGARLGKLEAAFDSLIAQDKPGSKKFGAGRIPFGGASGILTDDANLVWDNTNKRLGIGIASPLATIHAKFTGTAKTGLRVEQISANGDTLLDLFNSDDTIGSGSNFILARTASGTFFQVKGDGTLYTPTTINVGNTIGSDLIYGEAGLADTKLHLYENSGGSGSAHMFLWAGQPGVTFNAGGVSFNWRQASGAAMGRVDTGTGGSFLRLLSNQADMNIVTTGGVSTLAQVWDTSGGAARIGVLGAAAVARQTSGANLTNNVTAGGTNDTITDWTNLTTYSTDAAAIRNAVYQLARKLKQVNDALRLFGWLT
jgi:hypothetical protein